MNSNEKAILIKFSLNLYTHVLKQISICGCMEERDCHPSVKLTLNTKLFPCHQSVFILESKSPPWGLPPGGPVVESLPARAEEMGSIPGRGRFHMLQGK